MPETLSAVAFLLDPAGNRDRGRGRSLQTVIVFYLARNVLGAAAGLCSQAVLTGLEVVLAAGLVGWCGFGLGFPQAQGRDKAVPEVVKS